MSSSRMQKYCSHSCEYIPGQSSSAKSRNQWWRSIYVGVFCSFLMRTFWIAKNAWGIMFPRAQLTSSEAVSVLAFRSHFISSTLLPKDTYLCVVCNHLVCCMFSGCICWGFFLHQNNKYQVPHIWLQLSVNVRVAIIFWLVLHVACVLGSRVRFSSLLERIFWRCILRSSIPIS